MTHERPILSVVEKRMLTSVRWGSRDARFDNPTMNALQSQRLVTSTIVEKRGGRLSVNRRWSITDLGVDLYHEQVSRTPRPQPVGEPLMQRPGPRPADLDPFARGALAAQVWRALRVAESPVTVRELWVRVGGPGHCSVRRLTERWRRAGLLALACSHPRSYILADQHSTPPRGRALDRKPSVRQRIWTAMRVLKRFDVPTLVMTAEVSRGSTTAVINELLRAGYLRSLSTGVAVRGTWSVYQLVRRSGRLAPKVQVTVRPGEPQLRILVDPNDGSRRDISAGAVSLRGQVKRAAPSGNGGVC